MDDMFQSLKAFLYDRASSPLFGAFVISWLFWNYRFILILLSGESYSDKFESIDYLIETTMYSVAWLDLELCFYGSQGLLFPLLSALAYIYVYPRIAEPMFSYSLKMQKRLQGLKKTANDSKIIDEKESREMFKRLADIEAKSESEIDFYQKQVKNLKDLLDEASNRNETSIDISALTEEQLNEVVKKYNLIPQAHTTEIKQDNEGSEHSSEVELGLLKIIRVYGSGLGVEDIATQINTKRSEAFKVAESLAERKFLDKLSPTTYRISDKGKLYLLREGHLD